MDGVVQNMLFVFAVMLSISIKKIDPEVKLCLLIKADLILHGWRFGAEKRKTSMREFWLHTRLPVTLGVRGFFSRCSTITSFVKTQLVERNVA